MGPRAPPSPQWTQGDITVMATTHRLWDSEKGKNRNAHSSLAPLMPETPGHCCWPSNPYCTRRPRPVGTSNSSVVPKGPVWNAGLTISQKGKRGWRSHKATEQQSGKPVSTHSFPVKHTLAGKVSQSGRAPRWSSFRVCSSTWNPVSAPLIPPGPTVPARQPTPAGPLGSSGPPQARGPRACPLNSLSAAALPNQEAAFLFVTQAPGV